MRLSHAPKPNRKLGEGQPRTRGERVRHGLAAAMRLVGTGLRRVDGRTARKREVIPGIAPEEPARARGPLRASGFIWIWGFAVALAVVSFVLHLSVRFDIIQAGYALSRAQSEQRQLRLDQRELRLELATLKAPGRIEEQARDELGMVRPEHDRIIRLGTRDSRLALRRQR